MNTPPFYDSSIEPKCVNTFRIAFTEEPKLFINQKDDQDFLGRLCHSSSYTEKLFILIHQNFADKTLKNNYIKPYKKP